MEWIKALQAVMGGPFWDGFWVTISKIYSENVMLALLVIVYWVSSRSYKRYFVTLVIGQLWVVAGLKGLIGIQRPPMDAGIRVIQVDTDGTFSTPSGHATGSASVFSALALGIRHRWFTALAILVILLVGTSRLYLGVHYPTDLLAGWALGLLLAVGLYYAWRPLEAALGRLPFGAQLALALLAPTALMALWAGIPVIARVGLSEQFATMGALAGIWVGDLLEERLVRAERADGLRRQVLNCLCGLVLVFAVRFALKAVMPAGEWADFIRYIGVGLTVALLAPWVFSRLPLRPAGKAVAS
ncbi:phosphatase PAP2 family protein [Limnochorda pilosa]|uniref:Phosphatidic acid phosphatase type 2/haloperoxidase domain-containing protein n=1 Tax=Limnochorda pilosa TaxID=1555112 RepID=A0A0K2SM00_LIMPI|nr:phosphatase PAP2 family protein [Limnochorda pilosa]BAS28143.1 hypothetical protein LIP_2302 [Limnochorda pilosa]